MFLSLPLRLMVWSFCCFWPIGSCRYSGPGLWTFWKAKAWENGLREPTGYQRFWERCSWRQLTSFQWPQKSLLPLYGCFLWQCSWWSEPPTCFLWQGLLLCVKYWRRTRIIIIRQIILYLCLPWCSVWRETAPAWLPSVSFPRWSWSWCPVL